MELKTKIRLVTEISTEKATAPKGRLSLVASHGEPVIQAPAPVLEPKPGGKRNPNYLGPAIDIEPDALAKYEAQGGWIAEHKIDGMWADFVVGNPAEGRPNVLSSRDANTPVISGSNLGDLDKLQLPWPEGSTLACELEAATEWATEQAKAKGYRSVHLYDVVTIGGQSARPLPLGKRRELLETMHGKIAHNDDLHSRVRLLEAHHSGFLKLYEQAVADGDEGVVIKRLDSVYGTHKADGKTDVWIRCKRWFTMDYVLYALGTTPSGVLTGEWGLFKNGKLMRTMKAAAPAEFLTPENIGVLVCEFKGWKRFKSGALRHASFVRVRTDKTAEQCTL